MIIKHVMEIYLDEEDLPAYASQIADDIEQNSMYEIDDAILDLAYELDYDDSYWDEGYDEFADKMTNLIHEELKRRNETVQNN